MSYRDQSSLVLLFEQTLRAFGSARLRVQGSSMLPAICPGDEIRVQSANCNSAEEGDVVAFSRDGRLFIHRVIGRDSGGNLLTQGDALLAPDAPVCADEYLGKVADVRRDGQPVPMKTSWLQRAAAALFRRSRTCTSVFQKFASL
jgi:signal peptidase I